MQDYQSITEAVQQNCHIADSRFAGDYTMCVYLLKMREFYRWEMGLPFHAPLPNADVGDWLTAREQLWEDMEKDDFISIPVMKNVFHPFDSNDINNAIESMNLVYSGGLGSHARPHFFLAERLQHERHGQYEIYVAGREFARDLTAPPAMAQGRTIYIRRESLRRMLWEKYEEWKWNRNEGAMSRALSFYTFDKDLEQALEAMTDHELESAKLHEIGEIQAGELLGESWEEMLISLPRSQAELMVRAVRDHMADCISTLPTLLEEGRLSSLHFYFGNFRAMRKELFPKLYKAYLNWQDTHDLSPLKQVIKQGNGHWQQLAYDILESYNQDKEHCAGHIVPLVENNKL
jgi:hypothetical protein